jgi:hypothetical protein
MKIQYISDLHFEYHDEKDIEYSSFVSNEENATILILAGDIGHSGSSVVKKFLSYVSKNWEYILYVPGNHEYYNRKSCKQQLFSELKYLCNTFPNVYLLDCDTITIKNQRFLGCTLWSTPEASDIYFLNDFAYIKDMYKPLEPCRFYKWNYSARIWLNENVREGDIVITHFMPIMPDRIIQLGIKRKYPSSSTDCYYGNTGIEETLFPKVKYWIFGHTHQKFQLNINSCMCLCNAYGTRADGEEIHHQNQYFSIDDVE